MYTIGSFDAKNRLSELLKRVQAGETILITNRNKPVARLMPPVDKEAHPQQAIESLLEWGDKHTLRLGDASLKSLIEEGRP